MISTSKAVQLVRPISSRQFEACSDALAQLSGLGPNARVKVLSIAGVSRQGKSTLLELLAGRKGAFKIADGTDPCTQGIHMLITPTEDVKDGFLVRFHHRCHTRTSIRFRFAKALAFWTLPVCHRHSERDIENVCRVKKSVHAYTSITKENF
jgi:hypothetical protein